MPSVLTGREVTALMRRHGVTIAELARRMNLPQARVRYVRKHGVTGKAFCLDWQEAIEKEKGA